MTTTETPAPAELVDRVREMIQQSGRQAQYASYLTSDLTQARAMGIMRQLRGFVAPPEGETYKAPPRGDGSGHGQAKPRYSDQATEAQVRFLNSLRTERGSEALTDEQVAKLTKRQASADIEAWKAIPRPRPEVVAAAKAPAVELEAGMYRVGDDWFKVQKSRQSGRMYAKRLVVTSPGQATFEYAAGAIRQITPEHRVTLEEAQQFGHAYGVCCNCGALLTDPKSIAAGIGPICAGKV